MALRCDTYENGLFQGSAKTPAYEFLALTPELLDSGSGSAVADGGGDSVFTFLQFAELAEG